ncbi:hypothetical protein A5650_11255 [Mycobacterium sp. 1164985.4]|nr:hypothetical protein A5650_11255 [Mycobacterium sp. 1164985.4]
MGKAEGGDLAVIVVGQPDVQQFAVDLGMELQRKRAAEQERLGRVSGAGQFDGARWQCPAIVVPLEPATARHQFGVGGLDVIPTDLG